MRLYYYIYETTNLINGKNYIGQHVTTDLNDGYMGSGKALRRAFKKYGKDKFKTEILMFAVNQAALNFFEKCLVTPEFIERKDNYNLKEGGGNGSLSTETKQKIKDSVDRFYKNNPDCIVKYKDSGKSFWNNLSHEEKEIHKKYQKEKCQQYWINLSPEEKAKRNKNKSVNKNIRYFEVMNRDTGQIIKESNVSRFVKSKGIDRRNFVKLLNGKIKSYKDYILLSIST